MDVTKLDLNYIELFALAYSIAEQVFGIEPIQAPLKKQKKIRKWINRTYIDHDDLPEKVLSFIDNSKSDTEFIEFMAECAKYINERGTWKEQLLQKATTNFPEDVKTAFAHLFGTMGYCDTIRQQEDRIILTIDETDAYKRSLILHTSTENHIDKFDLLNFSEAQILNEGHGYKLICIAENFENETSMPIGIFFDYATTEIEVFRADRKEFDDNPWETLSFLASNILEKSDLGGEYLNQKEQGLIALLKEVRALSVWASLYNDEIPDFAILKQYIQRHNLIHLLPLIDKVTALPKEKMSRAIALARLTAKLNEAVCEPLWRELYELLIDTQEGYADKTGACNKKKLNEIRLRIEEKFHNLGYEGEYPTFRKKSAIKGIRLEESYNQTYFVGAEKNVEHIVQCVEFMNCDSLNIQFICGTAFLKKDETITDIYSCCFNKKGRRLFKKINCAADDTELLDQFATIAAKRAECAKLSKKEKELLGKDSFSWNYFISMFVFTGGLFAVFMTAAAFLILCLVDAILFGFSDIPNMISQMPWWFFFLIGFVGFGGAMAIVDAKAKAK